MNNDKDIQVALVGEEGDFTPFIEVDYVDKYAQEHQGIMLLDSGSSESFLSPEMGDSIGELCQLKDVTYNIQTATGEVVNANNVHFSFAVGGSQFSETFCINDNHLSWLKGIKIIGILGNTFLRKHGLVIDYNDCTLHTSHVSPANLSIADCDFFFPMEIGLKNYGIPVLCMKQGNHEIAALADTGSNSNMISETAINDGIICKFLGTKDTISGLVGQMIAKDAILDFGLLSLKARGDKEFHYKENVKVIPINVIEATDGQCNEEGRPLEPVQAVIGAPFMAREGWILDFGAKIIYKPKHAHKWTDNISVRVAVRNDKSEDEKETGRIRFFADAVENGMPFIRISEGKLKDIIMMIDTGAANNVLFGSAHNELKDFFHPIEGSSSLFGIDGKEVDVNLVEGELKFCGKTYAMSFLVKEDGEAFEKLSEKLGFPVSGIIGTGFMAEHNWVIDFGKQEIIIPKGDVSIRGFASVKTK